MRRTTNTLLLIFALVALCLQLATAQAPPAPGGPPSMSCPRPVLIGPKDNTGMPRPVRAKITAVALPPQDLRPASVELFFDDTLLGKAAQPPYKADFDTTTVADGAHTLKAVGRDANGQNIWSSTCPVMVRNSARKERSPQPGQPDSPAPRTEPTAPAAPAAPATQRPHPVVDTPRFPLDKAFDSEKYGFSIRYPANWNAKDETAKAKPKKNGTVWLVLRSVAADTAPLTVNVRRSQLQPGTDADMFAKFNSYVSTWERKTILGSPAFATTSGTQQSKRVIHRLIIIKDGCSWMLNCIDTTGGAPDISKTLFESMVGTLTINPKPSVSVTEIH